MKSFFKYKGNISRIGFILILIGIFLTLVSFLKGIQILMFIPALVIALFIFSYFEVKRLRKILSCNLIKEGKNYVLYLKSTRNIDFFFRIGYKIGNEVILMKPDPNDNFFLFPSNQEVELIVFIKGTFDVLRHVVNLGNLNRMGHSNINRNANQDYTDTTFFFVREYEPGDNLVRLDSLKSALKNFPFVKSLINFDITNKKLGKDRMDLKLLVRSNEIIIPKNEISKGLFLKSLMIILNAVVIYIQWENVLLFLFVLIPAILSFYKIFARKFLFKNLKILNILILALFVKMIFLTIILRDMTGPGSVFLTQILIAKLLFVDEREDGFLYIFLSLFVFVAVSLFSIELWFILFFLVYLIFSVFLLTSVSGYMVTDPVKGELTTKISNFKILKVIALIFFLMFFMFFALPHGNKNESEENLVTPRNPDSVSGFSNELNFQNAAVIKGDNSKVIAINIKDGGNTEYLKNAYWRGERFYTFNNNSWTKITEKKVYFKKKSNSGSLKYLDVTYLKKGNSNIFFPKIPGHVDFSGDSFGNVLYVNNFDNSIYYLRSKITNPLSLRVGFEIGDDNKIKDSYIEFKNTFNKTYISSDVKKLFQKFWSGIDRKKYNTPEKLTAYIKSRYGFEYSILSPSKNIEDFLYGTKKGYCEYYSTVLALTLQNFGYRATVVNGYYSGENNEMAKSWIIRGKDAHSWVEVFDNGKWVVYDATPNILNIDDKPIYTRIWEYIVSIYDYLDLKWYAYIVNYTGEAQKELFYLIFNYKIQIMFGFLIVFVLYLFKLVFDYYRKKMNMTYEEELLKILHDEIGQKFPLEYYSENYPDLVERTRKLLYSNQNINKKDFLFLKRDWNKIIER